MENVLYEPYGGGPLPALFQIRVSNADCKNLSLEAVRNSDLDQNISKTVKFELAAALSSIIYPLFICQ